MTERAENIFECPGRPGCARICQALGRQGLQGETVGKLGECDVPQRLVVDEAGEYKIEGFDTASNPELVGRLVQSLTSYLQEYHHENAAERRVFTEIRSGFEGVQAARDLLYGAMLTAVQDGGLAEEEMKYYQEQVVAAEGRLLGVTGKYSPEEVLLGRAAFDRRCLDERGIIFTDDMVYYVERLINNTTLGKPTMLQGDKGIAKTQAVKYISRLIAPDKEPLIISMNGDTMAHAFTGRYAQDSKTGRVVFQDSNIIQAAREGRPVLIDEANFGDTAVTAALHDILLKKPGDILTTEVGEEVEIKPGFMICMTANEGDRYQNRVDFDAALKDRLDIVRFAYPDCSKNPHTDMMGDTLRLAFAAAVDSDGELSRHITVEDLVALARLAHVSQQLYTQPAQHVQGAMSGIQTPERSGITGLLDERPVMSNCISPRDMIDAIGRVARGTLLNTTLASEVAALLGKLDKDGEDYNKRILAALYEKGRSAS